MYFPFLILLTMKVMFLYETGPTKQSILNQHWGYWLPSAVANQKTLFWNSHCSFNSETYFGRYLTLSYQHRFSRYKGKIASQSFYLYNGKLYTWKDSLYIETRPCSHVIYGLLPPNSSGWELKYKHRAAQSGGLGGLVRRRPILTGRKMVSKSGRTFQNNNFIVYKSSPIWNVSKLPLKTSKTFGFDISPLLSALP